MLEVKHLKKTYHTKNGVATKALDDVSLNFPETGMVFILGKSGSGKSTLLNVCGGLDKADSGEIIIKGKSSKAFTGPDFDSYRNTYVGFVFQEYNILEEFTVAENIALALELQNKKNDRKVVNQILEDVDLKKFAARKPNTLSGGQKQRVAIARALVKNPEIIMADEPTGALDSKTGKQVFDTLKKLSETKLVIVISHDRDFAEQYGDRIIELKDGKIISDQTRATEGDAAKNVRFYGADTVCVANGAELTDEDMAHIRTFLSRSGGGAVISTSRERIEVLQADAPELQVGAFEDIKEQPAVREYPPQKLIRSHLPVGHAIRMGAGSLKTKPIRLFFTVLLSLVAFIMFGLASTVMLFNEKGVLTETFVNGNIDKIELGKSYTYTNVYRNGDGEEERYRYERETRYTAEEYKALLAKYPGAIAYIDSGNVRSTVNVNMTPNLSKFYTTSFDRFVLAGDALNLMAGRMPTAADEIALSSFMADGFINSHTTLTYTIPDPEKPWNDSVAEVQTLSTSDYQGLLYSDSNRVRIRLGDSYGDEKWFKIVGIFQSDPILAEYTDLKQKAENNESPTSSAAANEWSNVRESGLYACAAVTEAFAKQYCANSDSYYNDISILYFRNSSKEIRFYADANGDYNISSASKMAKYGDSTLQQHTLYNVKDASAVSTVENGQVALPFSTAKEIISNIYSRLDNEHSEWYVREQADSAYREEHPEPSYPNYEDYDSDTDAYNAALDAYNAYFEDKEQFIRAALAANRRPVTYDRLKENLQAEADTKFEDLYTAPTSEGTLTSAQQAELQRYSDYRSQWTYRYIAERDPIEQLRLSSNSDSKLSKDDKVALLRQVYSYIREMDGDATLYVSSDNGTKEPATLVATYFDGQYDSGNCYLGEDLYADYYYEQSENYGMSYEESDYEPAADAYINKVVVPYDRSRAMFEDIYTLTLAVAEDGSKTVIANEVMSNLQFVFETVKTLRTVFLIIGLVLALFAFLLMFNFISASITAKKKEIGILRAIGARTLDVFKIFLSEAAIIALVCFVLSTVGTIGVSILLNRSLASAIGISVFSFGPLSAVMIFGIALITAAVSTVIPVALYSRKPPVDSIRAL